MGKKLVIGASGQIGVELIERLSTIFGASQVIASDIKPSKEIKTQGVDYIPLDVLDKSKLLKMGLELTRKLPNTALKNIDFSFSKILFLATQNAPFRLNLLIINLYGYYKRMNIFFKSY